MDVVQVADIGNHGHADVLQLLGGEQLRFAELGPTHAIGVVRVPRGELHAQEWEVVAPLLTPVLDHRLEQRAVLVGAAGVGFALIPDGTLEGERVQRVDHCVVEAGGNIGADGLFALRRVGGVRGVILEFGNRFESGNARPGFGRRAAPRRVNDADGDVQTALDVVAEGVGHRGEPADRFGAALVPLGEVLQVALVVDGCGGGPPFNGEEPEVRVLRTGSNFLRVVATVNGHLHVRLPGADPHLTDRHVLELNLVLTRDLQRIAGPGLGPFGQLDGPFAVLVCLSLDRAGRIALEEADRHFFIRVGFAPHGHIHISLKDHVVREERMRRDVGADEAGRYEHRGSEQINS